jgi:hypothetical protein
MVGIARLVYQLGNDSDELCAILIISPLSLLVAACYPGMSFTLQLASPAVLSGDDVLQLRLVM